jgi:hypothetical protein
VGFLDLPRERLDVPVELEDGIAEVKGTLS